MSSEAAVGEDGDRRMVTFVDSGVSAGSPAGVFPSSQDSIVLDTTNGTSCDNSALGSASSGVSGDLPVSASGDITNAVSVDSGSVVVESLSSS